MKRSTFMQVKICFLIIPLLGAFWLSGWDWKLMGVLFLFSWSEGIAKIKIEDVN